jgi:hypothetical protein
MTPERQRIAIAEACGWKSCRVWSKPGWQNDLLGYSPHDPFPHCNGEQTVPDYLNDLNAMSEAEAVADKLGMWLQYVHELAAVTTPAVNNEFMTTLRWTTVWPICTATAAQRAEAFLKTIGKWEES